MSGPSLHRASHLFSDSSWSAALAHDDHMTEAPACALGDLRPSIPNRPPAVWLWDNRFRTDRTQKPGERTERTESIPHACGHHELGRGATD